MVEKMGRRESHLHRIPHTTSSLDLLEIFESKRDRDDDKKEESKKLAS